MDTDGLPDEAAVWWYKPRFGMDLKKGLCDCAEPRKAKPGSRHCLRCKRLIPGTEPPPPPPRPRVRLPFAGPPKGKCECAQPVKRKPNSRHCARCRKQIPGT
jgi:hypothetical protein